MNGKKSTWNPHMASMDDVDQGCRKKWGEIAGELLKGDVGRNVRRQRGNTHENLSKIRVLILFMFDLDCDCWSYYRGLLSVQLLCHVFSSSFYCAVHEVEFSNVYCLHRAWMLKCYWLNIYKHPHTNETTNTFFHLPPRCILNDILFGLFNHPIWVYTKSSWPPKGFGL